MYKVHRTVTHVVFLEATTDRPPSGQIIPIRTSLIQGPTTQSCRFGSGVPTPLRSCRCTSDTKTISHIPKSMDFCLYNSNINPDESMNLRFNTMFLSYFRLPPSLRTITSPALGDCLHLPTKGMSGPIHSPKRTTTLPSIHHSRFNKAAPSDIVVHVTWMLSSCRCGASASSCRDGWCLALEVGGWSDRVMWMWQGLLSSRGFNALTTK